MKRAFGKLRLKISKCNVNDPQPPPSKPVPMVPQDPASIGLKMIHDSPDATIEYVSKFIFYHQSLIFPAS